MAILTNGADASGAIGEIITDGECKTLHGLLKVLRSKKHPGWLGSFIERLTFCADADEKPDWDPIDIKEILSMLLNSVNEDIKEEGLDALLYLCQGRTLTPIDPDEHAMILRYLAVQRSRSWLASFMDVECRVFDTQKNRTPEQVIRGLVGTELEDFECDIDTTRRMLEQHPDLFTSGEKHYMSSAEFKEVETHLTAMRASKAAEPENRPDQPEYQLAMVENGSHKEDFEMTATEFKALKKTLAAMRAPKPGKGKRKAA